MVCPFCLSFQRISSQSYWYSLLFSLISIPFISILNYFSFCLLFGFFSLVPLGGDFSIQDFSCFLRQACIAMTSNCFCCIPKILKNCVFILICPKIVCLVSMYLVFAADFYFMPQWLENMPDMISLFLILVRFELIQYVIYPGECFLYA